MRFTRRAGLTVVVLLTMATIAQAVTVSNVSLSGTSIPKYTKLEVQFDVTTSASKVYYPYNATDDGYGSPQGITVNATVTQPDATQLTVPAFYYVPYRKSTINGVQALGISGPAKWMVRFAPMQTGSHSLTITATDASGTTTSSSSSFSGTSSSNKGFLRMYSSDKRFMAYDDGSSFVGISDTGTYPPDAANKIDSSNTLFTDFHTNGVNLTRLWDQSDGYNLALEGSYPVWSPGWSQYSNALYMDTATKRTGNRAAKFLPRSGGNKTDGYFHYVAVKANTTYTLAGYIKTSSMTGTGAFLTASATGEFYPNTGRRSPVQTGTVDWTQRSVTFTTGASETAIGIWAGAENSAGTAWFDDLTLIESGQSYNILSDPGFERHFPKADVGNDPADPVINLTVPKGTNINQWAAYEEDQILDSALANGVAIQLCSHGDVYWTWDAVVDGDSWAVQNGFQVSFTDSKHIGYWKRNLRYRVARWGYNPAVLAWEVWNEHGNIPSGSGAWNFYNTLGPWMDTTDPFKHQFTTSMGSQCYSLDFWANNYCDVPNYHDYVTTSMLGRHSTQENEDDAYFVYYGAYQYLTNPWAGAKKPWIWGEIGILTDWNTEDPVANGAVGGPIISHNFLWAGLFSSIFTSPIDWNSVPKYPQTKAAAAFFAGEPYHTSNWTCYATSDCPSQGGAISTGQAKLRVLGLKASSNQRFLAWCQHKDHTWAKVARDGQNPTAISGSFTTPSLNAGNYRIEWWNAYTGVISSQSNVTHGGGGMTLTLPSSITTDVAVKVIYTGGGGGDTTAPGNISNLSAPSSTSNSVTLNWTAPGDDGTTGTATTYDIRRSTSTINSGNWDSATPVTGEPAPQVAGTAQSMTVSGLSAGTTYYFAMKTADEVPNTSGLSNVVSKATTAVDTTAPSAVSNLSAPSSTSSSVTLNWTATGDDNGTGTATSYDIRYSTSTITDANWGSATPCTGEPTPKASGQSETFTVNGLNASTTYYFAMKVSDEVPNTSGLSNVVSKATSAGGSNLLTQGDFQAGTAFTNATYTAGTSSDGVWYASSLTNTANAGDAGSGDYAAKVNNNYSDLRLFQGIAAPANGTSMTLSFKYIRPSGMASYVRVYGLTSGQAIQPWAGGTLQGTQLFNYDLSNQSSWASVNNQTFTVSGTFAKLAVVASVSGNATICLDDFVLTSGGGGGDVTAPAAVNNLSAPSSTSTSVTLNWTAPGDDGSTGTAASYDVRYSTSTITDANWGSATPATGEPTPAVAGTAQSMTVSGLNAGTTYYFAMKTADEVPNTSGLSNVVSKATAASGPFFSDDFQGETNGQVPSKWTCNNSSFQTVAESTNKLLKNVGTDSHVWPSDCDSNPSRWQNFEMLCRVRDMQQIDFRLPGSGSSLRLQATTGGVTLYEMPGWTSKGSRAALTAGTWYWMRLQCNGSSVKVRFWADGTSEPSTTDISATTTVTATGKVDFNYQGNISIDDVTVSSSFTQMN